MKGMNLTTFINRGDRVAIGDMTGTNLVRISALVGRLAARVVGGWSSGAAAASLPGEHDPVPAAANFSELLEILGRESRPNRVALCSPPGALVEELQQVVSHGSDCVKGVFVTGPLDPGDRRTELEQLAARHGMSIHFFPLYMTWDEEYEQGGAEEISWYIEELDPDLDLALARLEISGGSLLDLGTGLGTQAVALARRGFRVTASDISPVALSRVKDRAGEVDWLVDDILDSRIRRRFAFILDRGCFHCLEPGDRSRYVAQVGRLLCRDGLLFLKTLSRKDDWLMGPHRFSLSQLLDIFGSHFDLLEAQPTIFQGRHGGPSRALFLVLRLRSPAPADGTG
jgi:2-polyprenyl-3-methyl-5-hydroxy-6-metoxy-1,4-benzoquinol methylase